MCAIEFQTTYPNLTTIQRLTNLGSYFYQDSFGFLRENKRLQCEVFSSKLRHDIEIPNGENARNWVANLVLKFHDDPMVNESEIVNFLR